MGRCQALMEELIATRRQLITQALQQRYHRRYGRPPVVYLILDDTVLPKRGKKLPELGFHFAPSEGLIIRVPIWKVKHEFLLFPLCKQLQEPLGFLLQGDDPRNLILIL